MNPIAFSIFGFEVRWYGIILSAAILTGIYIAAMEAKRQHIDTEFIIDLALWTIPSSIIGARLYYVIFEWSYYKGDFLRMINIREGGLAIHGALIAAFLSGYIFTKYKKMSFLNTADICAPAIVMGQAIGRWGNFMNGEAHGGPTNLPWGIIVDGIKVHPTFLYESLWNLGVFAILILLRKNKKYNGQIFLTYGILYSLGRFWIEALRTDSLLVGGMKTAQLVSLAVILIFSTAMYFLRKNKSNW